MGCRASDDPEKTNTTCLEESQPSHGKKGSGETNRACSSHLFLALSLLPWLEITIRVDETECLSMASSHDQETERFLCTGTTGRRVSFNEAALLDHGKKTQEKGRRSDPRRGCHLHASRASPHISCLYISNDAVHTQVHFDGGRLSPPEKCPAHAPPHPAPGPQHSDHPRVRVGGEQPRRDAAPSCEIGALHLPGDSL